MATTKPPQTATVWQTSEGPISDVAPPADRPATLARYENQLVELALDRDLGAVYVDQLGGVWFSLDVIGYAIAKSPRTLANRLSAARSAGHDLPKPGPLGLWNFSDFVETLF